MLAKDNHLLIELYKDGYSIQQIADNFNISYSYIRNIIKPYGVIKKRGPYRKININDNIFFMPDNNNCYWAGFIAADGNIQGNQLGIELNINDYKHLEKFKRYINLNGSKIFVRKCSCAVRFRSNQIVKDLYKNFNVIPNKSLILCPPNITDVSFIRHYIRGYFDGDGCISINSKTKNMSFEIYSGSYKILDWLLYHIKNIPINTITRVRKKVNNTYRFAIYGNNQIETIMNWLYKDSGTNFLERKRNIYISYLEVIKHA
jgi:intein-encoded DNA endonuclease-like protein